MGVSGVIGENGRIFGGSERHLGIVGAPTLKLGGPMDEVELERSLDGGWVVVPGARRSASCQGAVWTYVESHDDDACGAQSPSPRVHIHKLIGALSSRPGRVPLSADDHELAKRWLRYGNDKSPRLQTRLWAFVECQYCGRRRRD